MRRGWDDILGARSSPQVGDLEAGGGVMGVAFVPDAPAEFIQSWTKQVHGVFGRRRVGHMALDADDGQRARQGAAPAVLDCIAQHGAA